MTATIERTLTAAQTRADIDFAEAALAEASKIMHCTKEQLNGYDAMASLTDAWRTNGQADTFEAFVNAVNARIAGTWLSNSDHAEWFEYGFMTELDLHDAVDREAMYVEQTPSEDLRFVETDESLHDSWKSYADADTYIAFVDKVYARLVKRVGADHPNAVWFRATFAARV